MCTNNSFLSAHRKVIFAIMALLFSGCAQQKVWTYRAENFVTSAPRVVSNVAVPPFQDTRPDKNSNMVGMYLIPLMPFGWMDLSTPEGAQGHVNSGMWLWRPNEDLAKATAEELNNARLFNEVFYTTRASEGDLVLQGTIKSTDYNGKIITYGLSVYGPMLWFIGLPADTFKNQLIVSFRLEDKKTHSILWQKEYRQDMGKTGWLYYMPSDFEYSTLTKKILMAMIRDVDANIQGIKAKLKTL